MIDQGRPLLLRFMSDSHTEIPYSVGPFVSDLLKMVSALIAGADDSTNGYTPSKRPCQCDPERCFRHLRRPARSNLCQLNGENS